MKHEGTGAFEHKVCSCVDLSRTGAKAMSIHKLGSHTQMMMCLTCMRYTPCLGMFAKELYTE